MTGDTPQGVSHVLAWTPPELTDDGSSGWELLDWDGTGTHVAANAAAVLFHAARNADPGALAQWVTTKLGHPVVLTETVRRVRPQRLRRWRTEPAYYVARWPSDLSQEEDSGMNLGDGTH